LQKSFHILVNGVRKDIYHNLDSLASRRMLCSLYGINRAEADVNWGVSTEVKDYQQGESMRMKRRRRK